MNCGIISQYDGFLERLTRLKGVFPGFLHIIIGD